MEWSGSVELRVVYSHVHVIEIWCFIFISSLNEWILCDEPRDYMLIVTNQSDYHQRRFAGGGPPGLWGSAGSSPIQFLHLKDLKTALGR